MASLLSLPDDVLENVLSYITYDEVSQCRLVCRRLNYISQRVLNHGFHKVEKYHAQCLRKVKVQLPRRESERRKHPLAKHCDILTTVETRLSLLEMTFMKFIDLDFCCFIPGKVIDEIYKVLRYVTMESNPVYANETLQELRDLSSMAMEYFDEKIAPSLKKKDSGPKIVTGFDMFSTSACLYSESSYSHQPASEHKLDKLYHFTKELAVKQHSSFKQLHILKQKVMDLNKKKSDLDKKIIEQQNMISSQAEKIKEQERKMNGMMQEVYIPPSLSELLCFVSDVFDSKRIKNNSVEICEINSPESPQKRKLPQRSCTVSNRNENFKKQKK